MSITPLTDEVNRHAHLDMEKIEAAYQLAAEVHQDQTRLSGEAYIHHPVAVALLLTQAGADEDMICAALLHDCIEDAKHPAEVSQQIEDQFGPHVFFMVDAVSKNQAITDSLIRHRAFISQLEAAFMMDVSVFFIKWADLLHNLESIELLKPEKKAKWLRELQQDYLPVLSDYFHRLSFRYHPMYHFLMDRFEDIASQKI